MGALEKYSLKADATAKGSLNSVPDGFLINTLKLKILNIYTQITILNKYTYIKILYKNLK